MQIMAKTVVTRFAPSPTGYMHIGNLRTALYSYLIAKCQDGKFILRIEDTDQERLVEGAVDVILNTLKQTGLSYDEGPVVGGDHGPYIQSERKDIYMKYAQQLIESGHAYYCFCTPERLAAIKEGDGFGGYDRHCRDLSKEQVEANLAAGMPYVIRQKMPLEGTTSYKDEVFGEISMENSQLQDQILIKADGYPTYNFAHVVDDHLMEVTHVVRGSEYLTSTPKYVLLYDAFGWERPVYCHLPLLMGKDAEGNVSKLSKRHGAVSFQDLVEKGYLPEAIINYIALLGWCPKETNEEFFTLDSLKEQFSIAAINKSPSVFDYDKLLWFNGEYIKKMDFDAFCEKAMPYLEQTIPNVENKKAVAALLQSRVAVFSEIPEKIGFLAKLPEYDVSLYTNKKNKTTPESCAAILDAAIPVLEQSEDWSSPALFEELKALAEKEGVKSGAVMWAVRIAVAGVSVTPGGATELMEILGKEESLARLKAGRAKL